VGVASGAWEVGRSVLPAPGLSELGRFPDREDAAAPLWGGLGVAKVGYPWPSGLVRPLKIPAPPVSFVEVCMFVPTERCSVAASSICIGNYPAVSLGEGENIIPELGRQMCAPGRYGKPETVEFGKMNLDVKKICTGIVARCRGGPSDTRGASRCPTLLRTKEPDDAF